MLQPALALGAIVVAQIANAHLRRSERNSILVLGLASNRLILAGIAVEGRNAGMGGLQRVGQAGFGTAPLPIGAWLFMLPFAAGDDPLRELRKAWLRRRGWQTANS